MNELKTLASNDGECVDSWPDAGGDCLMEEVGGGSVSVSGSANASPNLAPTVPLAGSDPPALPDTKGLKGKGKVVDVNVAKKLVSFTNSNSILKNQSLSLGKGKVVLKASAPSSSSTSTSLTATTTTTTTTTTTEAGAAGTEPVAMIPMMSETERGRRAEARAPVCARCWEENRKLARWRLRWMCDAIPGMFGLDIDAHAGGAGMGLGVGEAEGMEGGFGSSGGSGGNASNANANGKANANANVSGKVKGGMEDELKSVNSVVRGMNSKAKEMVKAK